MNELSKAASILGKKGGQSGTGTRKARSPEVCRKAVIARWGPLTYRFWRRVDKKGEEQCWPFLGAYDGRSKYKRISVNGKRELVHRVAWRLTYGDAPKGLFVCHHCDFPICCNPKHLFVGTPKDNMQDMISKKRNVPPRGSINGHSKLTEQQVNEIKKMYHDEHMLQKDIAKIFRVRQSAISRILTGVRWKHTQLRDAAAEPDVS